MRAAERPDEIPDDDDEAAEAERLNRTGKEIKKLVKKSDKTGAYESDDDVENPYASVRRFCSRVPSLSSGVCRADGFTSGLATAGRRRQRRLGHLARLGRAPLIARRVPRARLVDLAPRLPRWLPLRRRSHARAARCLPLRRRVVVLVVF